MFLLDQNHLLLMNKERTLIVHAIFLLSECVALSALTQLVELLVSEWWRQFNNQANEIGNTDPASCVRIVLHPRIKQAIHIVCINDAKVLQFRIF